MSSFTTPLEITPAPAAGPGCWATTRPLAFYLGEDAERVWLETPAGFVTDLGTIPTLLWPLLPPHDPRFAAAFVLHDDLCKRRGFPRLVADAAFRHALRVLAREHQAARWRPEAMYAGVRLWALWRALGRVVGAP